MKFNKLADVLAHAWTGKGGNVGEPDFEAYEALNAYVQSDEPVSDRCEALNYVFERFYGSARDRRDPSTVVREYIREWCSPDADD